ncbi:MAG TPA: hypothetical protein VFY05_01040, partial [Candidatus Angelobacter sp.]|nr:hypothetical protein [Candidatus Angelobacter sp.]
MHRRLSLGLTVRATSARRIFAVVVIALMVFALPALAQQAQPAPAPPQQQARNIANPETGSMPQQQASGEAREPQAGGEANLPMPDMA